jgi:endonuclease YncB( thermonuclease family)
MIGEGLAEAKTQYSFSRMSAYEKAEQLARLAKVGMWRDTAATRTAGP